MFPYQEISGKKISPTKSGSLTTTAYWRGWGSGFDFLLYTTQDYHLFDAEKRHQKDHTHLFASLNQSWNSSFREVFPGNSSFPREFTLKLEFHLRLTGLTVSGSRWLVAPSSRQSANDILRMVTRKEKEENCRIDF